MEQLPRSFKLSSVRFPPSLLDQFNCGHDFQLVSFTRRLFRFFGIPQFWVPKKCVTKFSFFVTHTKRNRKSRKIQTWEPVYKGDTKTSAALEFEKTGLPLLLNFLHFFNFPTNTTHLQLVKYKQKLHRNSRYLLTVGRP